ncbi:HIT family protein [Massilia cavernae]|uniref:HIT family protein n=1 Tax=Massilia cavernae TaxID=2320864 RepID=A0A418Y771_9BURK|nr:HIT family protein [Massilia cavernae]RJG25734.1 HIT family protein [Massilia cavernae]
MTGQPLPCELCELAVPTVYRDDKLSVIIVDDAAYPGFCRVIWNKHVKEMSDLPAEDRALLNDAVYRVEKALVDIMKPAKVNLASLGNMVPHLHWHLIPRYADDAQFPSPVWAPAVRTTDENVLAQRRALLPQLAAEIARRMEERP